MAKLLSMGTWAYAFGPYQSNPVPFDTVVKKLGELKYDGVEIGAFKPHIHPDDYPTAADRQKVKDLIKECGLRVSGLAADFWGDKGPATDAAQKDDYYLKLFQKNLTLCTDLGSPSIRVDTVSPPDGAPGVDRATAWKRITELWRRSAKLAAEKNVKMVWEFEPGFLFNKPSEVVELVKAVNHPNFSILFDTCHAYMCAVVGARQPGTKETLKGGVAELARMLKGHIGHLHVIDSDGTLHGDETSTHRPFGEGMIDFNEVLDAVVKDAGYKGEWFTVDLCFWPEAWEVTEKAKEFLTPYLKKY
ncbi:MAG TPA: sugar phosphate isomerase/epimerase family protein [Planctomycetota bacterium]|nr:sugar phosphate isomerase/epimerase family protein [Planctomycetota bacterium]